MAALLAIGLVPGAPAVATTVDSDSAWPEELIRDYTGAYPELSAADVTDRLDHLTTHKLLQRGWLDELTGVFGGSWYDFRSDVVHVNVTEDSAYARVRADVSAAGLTGTASVVTYSLEQLAAIRAELVEQALATTAVAEERVYLDITHNRVVVEADSEQQERLGALPSGAEVIPPRPEPESPAVPVACNSRYDCGKPLRGGTNVGPWNSSAGRAGNECSLGFTASAADGTRWVLTAGHCTSSLNQVWGHGEQQIGRVRQIANVGSVDFARIRIENSYWLGAGGGYMFHTTTSTVEVDYAITSRQTIWLDDPVCFNAASYVPTGGPNNSHDNCGRVAELNSGHRGMVDVAGVDACRGDSGGSTYLALGGERWAYGLLSGIWNLPSSAVCMDQARVVFSPLPDIYNHLDVTTDARVRVEVR